MAAGEKRPKTMGRMVRVLVSGRVAAPILERIVIVVERATRLSRHVTCLKVRPPATWEDGRLLKGARTRQKHAGCPDPAVCLVQEMARSISLPGLGASMVALAWTRAREIGV